MVKVKDFIEQNQEDKTIFIHLENEKADPYDPMIDVLWEGYLKDVPEEYHEKEVVKTSQSLRDNERGINGFYLTLKKESLYDYPEINDFLNSVFEIIEIRAIVGRENGVSFEVRTKEKNHTVAHVHASYGEYNISIAIETGEVLSGNLPRKQSKRAQEWVLSHQNKLKGEWSKYSVSAISHMTMSGLGSSNK